MNGLGIYILCGLIYGLLSIKSLNLACDRVYALLIKEKPDFTETDFLKLKLFINILIFLRVLLFPVLLLIEVYYILKILIKNGKKR